MSIFGSIPHRWGRLATMFYVIKNKINVLTYRVVHYKSNAHDVKKFIY